MRSALLRGRDCHQLGAIETIAEGAVAIALSRGGAAKVYDYIDPNEDCCLFALGDGGVLVALADGHNGEYGARRLIEAIEAELLKRPWNGRNPAEAVNRNWSPGETVAMLKQENTDHSIGA